MTGDVLGYVTNVTGSQMIAAFENREASVRPIRIGDAVKASSASCTL